MRVKAVFFVCFAALTLSVAGPYAHAQKLSGDASIADVTEKAMPSVVNISSTRPAPKRVSPFYYDPWFGTPQKRRRQKQYATSLGSGVVVSKKGLILTNNHVVANATDIKVGLADGREYKAKLVGADPKSDLAVLKLSKKVEKLEPIKFGDSSKMRLGDIVLAIGNPFGVGQTVTMGIVSAKGRGNMGIVDYEDFIQTDAAINPGNSGGALVNMDGELVGINTAILSRTGGYQGIGFAIPSDMAKPIMDSLIASGKVVRGWLGVTIQSLNAELAKSLSLGVKKGVVVTQVHKNSPAKKAGIRRDDVIVRVGKKKTYSPRELSTAVANAGAKSSVKVVVYRNGKKKKLTVKLGEMPDEDLAAKKRRLGRRGKKTSKALGMKVKPLNQATRKKLDLPSSLDYGVLVTNVEDGGVAERYLQSGDVILEVNKTKVKSAKQLGSLYRKAKRNVTFLVYRDGAAVYLMFTK